MFETVVPETYQVRSKKLLYETLPLSVAVHALAFFGAILGASWNVAFPTNSPALSATYSLTSLPEPPPPPPPPPKPAEAVPVAPKVAIAPPPLPQALELAPRVIPDMVPKIELAPPPPRPVPVAQASSANVGGSAEGSLEGKLGGQIGGHGKGLTGSLVFPDDGRVYIERDAKLPLTVLKQDYPLYPDEARDKHQEDTVLVRYVIGTDGKVKDVTILDHAKNPVFDKSTVDAISQWRFRPMMQNGKPVEVVHELTVYYQMIVR